MPNCHEKISCHVSSCYGESSMSLLPKKPTMSLLPKKPMMSLLQKKQTPICYTCSDISLSNYVKTYRVQDGICHPVFEVFIFNQGQG